MSMISAQCNELRDTADKLDKTSAVSTSWIHYKLTPMMRDAADTIWQLRDDLQRANGLLADAEHDESRAWDVVHKAKAENAKLRELVRLMVRRQTPISPCKDIPCGECPVRDECDQEDALMRELGIEVS